VHVHDVARANLAGLRAGVPGTLRAFNVASGEPHTVGEMAAALSAAFGGPAPEVTGRYRLGDVRHVVASPGAAARGLGFRAETSFAAGMREFAHAPLRRPASATRAGLAGPDGSVGRGPGGTVGLSLAG